MTTQSQKPDIIFYNGDFRTQDPHCPQVQAVAINAGRILATGPDATVKNLQGPNTRMINLEGRLGLPGFIDTHFHFYEWATSRLRLDFSEVKSFQQCLGMLKAKTAEVAPGQWILGQGFNESDWPENRLPNRSDLDAVAPENPVLIWRCDLHLAVANSLAMQQAGINRDTNSPPDGIIVKGPDNEPTGVLKELAINPVRDACGRPGVEAAAAAIGQAISAAHTLGLTGVHDIRLMGGEDGPHALQAWQLCKDNGKLKLRVWCALPGERLDEAIALGLRTGFGDDLLRIGHLKYFGDGGMGARTAWLTKPYRDAGNGMPLTPMAKIEADLNKAAAAGLAIMVHAIGDRTSQELTELFERFEADAPPGFDGNSQSAWPHRIEHLQMVRPEIIKRLGRLNVVGTVVPHNLPLDINMIDQCLGPEGRHTYPLRALLDAGVPIMLSSDCPVCDPAPLAGIHAAVTRCRKDGTPEGGWYPEQKLTVDEAVRGYTLTPAIASGAGDSLGSITPGKMADLIVIDRNIFTIEPAKILEARVVMTVFNGNLVYESL